MKIAAIIVNYNSWDMCARLAVSLEKDTIVDDVVLVENGSSDDSFVHLKQLEKPGISVVSADRNGGYGYGNNLGIRYAKQCLGATHALIINPDVVVSDALIRRMGALFAEERIAVVSAAQHLVGKGRIDAAWNLRSKGNLILGGEVFCGILFDRAMHKAFAGGEQIRQVDCVAGSMLMVDIAKFLEVGGYDEEIFLYFEEEALGWKMQKWGYQTLSLGDECYWHYHSKSIDRAHSLRRKRFLLWQSKSFYLRRYLNASFWEMQAARLFHSIGTTELLAKNFFVLCLNKPEEQVWKG